MRVLVACEYSGAVRDSFIAEGHDAMSCDLLPTDSPGPHYQGDVFDIIDQAWDLMVAHPPCTHLAVSGARHFAAKRADGRQQEGIDFFMGLVKRSAHIPKTAIENPVCIMSTVYRKADQTVQPWWFGEEAFKATCLWLKGLSPLVPTNRLVPPLKGTDEHKRWSAIHLAPPGPLRWKIRSKTYPGISAAMASQWGAE